MEIQPVQIRSDFHNISTHLSEDQIERLLNFVKELEEEPDVVERD